MAVNTGTYKISGNFEVDKAGPLDSRDIVDSSSDLALINRPYLGMKVTITGGSSVGDYRLVDVDNVGNLSRGWVKVGGVEPTMSKHIALSTTQDIVDRVNNTNEDKVIAGDNIYILDSSDPNAGQWIIMKTPVLPFVFAEADAADIIIKIASGAVFNDVAAGVYSSARELGKWETSPYFEKVFVSKHDGASDKSHSYLSTINGSSGTAPLIGSSTNELAIGINSDMVSSDLDINKSPLNSGKNTPDTFKFLKGTGSDSELPINYSDLVANNLKLISGIRSSNFITGTSGWELDGDNLEVKNLTVRGGLSASEFTVNKVRSTNGNLVITDALNLVSVRYSGSGLVYYLTFKDVKTFADVPFIKDDYLQIQQFSPSGKKIIRNITMQAYGNFNETSMELPILVTNHVSTGSISFSSGDTVVRIGSSSDDSRRNTIWLYAVGSGAPSIKMVKSKASLNTNGEVDYDTGTVIGNLSGVGNLTGNGLFTDNGYFTGDITAKSGTIGGSHIDDTAMWAGNKDKQGYVPKWILNNDGSGQLGQGGLSWNYVGGKWVFTFSDSVLNMLKGKDSPERYTWIKYADDENGTGMSDISTNKKYIGFSYNNTLPLESTDPLLYEWTKIRGEDGAFPYPYNPTTPPVSGNGLALTDTHLGFYKNGVGASNTGWMTFMDSDGNFQLKGQSGTIGPGLYWDASNSKLAINGKIETSEGKIANWIISTDSMEASNQYGGVSLNAANREVKSFIDDSNYIKMFVDSTDDYGLKAVVDGKEVFRAGKDSSGIGIGNLAGWEFNDTMIKSGNIILDSSGYIGNEGKWKFSSDGSGSIAGGNIWWDSTGNVNLTSNVTLTWDSLSQDAKTNLEGPQGPAGYTPIKGVDYFDGAQGVPGKDAPDIYTWIRYADNEDGDGISNNPTGKNFMGLAYNKDTATESNDPLDYTWSRFRGIDGTDGTSVVLTGSVQNYSDLKSIVPEPAVSSLYMVLNTGDGYVKGDSGAEDWTNVGPIQGPRGDRGLTGPKGDTGVVGPKGSDGIERWTWIRYSDNANGSPMYDTPKATTEYIGIAPNQTTSSENTTDPSLYTWSKFKGDQGPQGVQGIKGVDGSDKYVWIKYASNVVGNSMSNNPEGKTYIGLAYNKSTKIESSNPTDYTWSPMKGFDGTDGKPGADGVDGQPGVPGLPGKDGTPRYTWIKYAKSLSQSGMQGSPDSNTKYIGLASNKTTSVESNSFNAYTWSLFKGNDGNDGARGPQGNTGPIGPRGYTGKTGPKGNDGVRGLTGASTFLYPSIPNRTPGLFANSSYMGYHDGSSWKTFMRSNGDFALSGGKGQGLTWNNDILSIDGIINAKSGYIGGFKLENGDLFGYQAQIAVGGSRTGKNDRITMNGSKSDPSLDFTTFDGNSVWGSFGVTDAYGGGKEMKLTTHALSIVGNGWDPTNPNHGVLDGHLSVEGGVFSSYGGFNGVQIIRGSFKSTTDGDQIVAVNGAKNLIGVVIQGSTGRPIRGWTKSKTEFIANRDNGINGSPTVSYVAFDLML